MRKIYYTLLLLAAFGLSFGQIVVTQSTNSQTLAQLLAGPGVTISNYTLTCNSNGSGTFNNVSSNLGIPGGAVLASGRVTSIPQVATNFASSSFTASGDAQLSTLTAGNIYDPCILEFDIVPQGPLLKFDYVFASEEYPEFVCSPYNDVFGFFISGPNPGGGNYTNKNIAIIPGGGTMPVAINSVNSGTSGTYGGTTWNPANCQSLGNTAYYVNNLSPVNAQIVYDGMTTVLTATSAVVPCQTYHLKIAIADVADRIYDSGVFLSAYSFTSNPISVSAISALDYAGFSSAYENCVGGTFTLTLSQVQTVDVYVNVAISGTATNGSDYTTIPAVVMIPAGQTSVTVDLNPLQDGLVEPAETVTLAVLDPCTGAVSSSASITIRDDLPATITATDTTLCLGQSTQLTANGGVTYTWSPVTGLSNPNIRNPIATPTVTTTYTVTMQFGACTKTVSQTIYVSNPTVSTSASPAGTVCNGGTVAITASGSGGVSPYNYLWSTGAVTPGITVATGGTYNVTSTDSYGCTASATRSVTISNLNISGTTTNVSCMGGTNGAIDVTVTGSNAPFTYNWGGGVTSQDRTNVVAGTYTVTASNTVGCSVTASFTITQPASNLTTSATNTSVTCNGGNNGSINLTVSGGVSPYTYLWSNSATTQDISSLVANTYTVTVTDNNGCTASRSVTVTQPTAVTTSETHVNLTCNGGANGSIDLSVGGGVGSYAYAWSNGTASQDLTGIAAGTYTVTVSDGSSCTATRSITITQPTAVAPVLTPTNVACFGGNSGTINSTTTGGTSPYTYLWSNAATTQNISAVAAGTYTLTATDNAGCSASASVTLTQPAAALSASTIQTNINCFGGNNGTITLTAAGGTTPYTYNWGGGVTTQNRTALAAGTYNVTVTDFRGCTATATATITQPTALSITNTRTNVSCNGGNNGSIDITVSGGASPYTYNWGGGVTTEDRTNLTQGTYNVTATDANACTVAVSISITQPTVLTFSETHVNNTCNGGNTGSINITVGGGTSPYTYNWGGGVTTEDRTGLTAGTYTVTAIDNNGCIVTGSATITQPTAINISEVVADATCAPGNNGAITLNVTGGSSPYTYNWGGGITTQNRSALFAGTYTVTVTDNTGCTAAKSISVSQLGTGMTLSTSVTNVNCFGGNNGAIDLTVTGGTAPITYNWGGGITTQDKATLTAGNYSVTVTDGLSCSAIANATIAQPTAISISATTTNVLCSGAATGAINITATGGTGVLTYNWGGGVTSEDRTAIGAGSYTVTVTDANGCTSTSASTITQPVAVVSAVAVNTSVSCFGGNNGTVTLTPAGGTGAYTFNWSNGSISQNLTTVAAGTYNVTVTDANGCTTTATSTVTQPSAALSAVLTPTDLTCNNVNVGSINNTVTGGTSPYTYNWGGGVTTQNRSGLAAGAYSVTVSDNRSCSASATVILTQPPAVTITITPSDVLCNGGNSGAITVAVTGGTGAYSYNWGGGITSQNRTGLTAGSYTVTVTDANSCTVASTTVVAEPSALTLTLNSGTSTCMSPTGTATAVTNNSGASPYNYVWSNGGANSQNQNGLPPGDISVTITDANSCSISASVTVGLAGNNTDANFNFSGSLCGPNAAVTFTHAGSSSIINHFWDFGNGSGNSTMPSPNYTYPTAGTYNVTHIVERGYCKDTVTRVVTINNKPVPTSVITNVSCNGMNNGAIDVSVSSGTPAFTYNWGGGITTQDRTGLAPGTYTITVTDANTCSASLSGTITQPNVLMVTYNNTNVTCNGGNNGAIDVSVTGGTTAYTYNWGGGVTTQDRTGLTGGTYNLTVTDANGCTSVNTIALYQPNAISMMPAVTNVTCNGMNDGSITLTVTGGTGAYTYTWGGSGGTTQTAASLIAGTYNVTVTDANSCTASSSNVVTQPAILTTSLSATPVSCFNGNNGTITSTTTGGTAPYDYSWNDGNVQTNRSSIAAGSYSVTIIDGNGCSVSGSVTVAQPATAVSVVVNSTNTLVCYGDNNGTINITASGGVPAYTYLWGDSSLLEDRTGMLGGTYYVTATDQNGCVATTSATINQPSQLTIDSIAVTNVLCFGSNTGSLIPNIYGGTTPYTYNWGGGVTTANRTNVPAGTYNLTVTDNNGCTATATATITEPASTVSASSVVTNVSCNGGNNGAIDLTATGGVTPYTFNWGGGITTEDRTALTAGTYNVLVADSNGCTVAASATVTQPTTLTVAVTSTTNVSCFGGNNGAINVSAAGGTTGYSYNWGGGVTTQNRTGLTAGTYNITVTDANSCTATTSATITQPVVALSVAVTSTTNVSCFGGNNGAININATGGTTAYSYNWGGGVITQNRIGLTAGTYNVTVTDANSCTVTTSATITQPAAALAVAVSSTINVSCFGGNNGAINITATGGTTAYSYNWGGGIVTQNRTGLTAGSYTVTVTDANSCTATTSATIAQPAAALAASAVATNVSCSGGNNGTITVSVTGGTTAYSFNWGGGVTTQNRSGLAAGTYTVTVTDFNSCTTTTGATITQPAVLSASYTTGQVSCNNGANGTINLTVNGGTSPFTYNWTGGYTTQNLNTLAAGTYDVTITDNNSCSTSLSVTVAQPTAIVVTTVVTDVACFNGSTGAIDVTVNGGTPSYTYVWNGGATTQDRTNLTAGAYQVTITDNNSCTTNTSATVNQPAAGLNATTSVTPVLCFGNSTGAIDVIVNGGSSPYVFIWNDAVTTEDRTNVTAGTYTVTITDNQSCSATTNAVVTQPTAALSLTTITTNVSCFAGNNGVITLNVTGGTTSYSFNWNDAVASQNRTGLLAGTYTVTVTDANGCTTTTGATITQPAAALGVAVVSTTNVSCFGGNNGAININATGGTTVYSYDWGGGVITQNRTGLTAGTYNVTVTDANSCTATISATITEPASALAVAVTSTTNVSCFGGNNGAININATGGTTAYSYNWGGGVTTQNITGLTAGTYNVTVTDANSCTATISATITQPAAALAVAVTTTNNVSCFGGNNGAINISTTGGTTAYSYNWGGGVTTQNRTGLVAGTYNVTVTDANSCTATTGATITQTAAPLSVAVSSVTNVSCFGGNNGGITVIASGGTSAYTYGWSDLAGLTTAIRTGLIAGSYTVTVTDANGCSATASATITQPAAALGVAVVLTTNVSCFGGNNGAININATGGTTTYNYNWGGGVTTQNRTGLTAGTYNVTVTDANSCTATTSATITQPAAALAVAVTSTTNVSCFGGNNGAININATGGTTTYNYNWGGGVTTQNRTGLTAGTYNVTVTDANSCTATTNATITEPAAALAVAVVSTTNVSCFSGNNGAININATGGTTAYIYEWGGGITTQNRTGLTAGIYNVTVTDANACTAIASTVITEPAASVSVIATPVSVSCFAGTNGAITLTVNGGTAGYTYLWNDAVTTQDRTNIAAGNYSVTVTDAQSCTATAAAVVTQPAAALSATTTVTNVSCNTGNNGTITLTVTGGTTAYAFNWNDAVVTQNRSNMSAGSYNVTVTDANSCSTTASATISEPAVLTISATPVDVLCNGGNNGSISTTVNGGTASYTYMWNDAVTSANRTSLIAGNYSVTVTDNLSCSASAAAVIAQPTALVLSNTHTDVSCFGGNSGSVDLTATGGTSPYVYVWSNTTTTQDITTLTIGTYTVSVTDAHNCSAVSSATVAQPTALQVSSAATSVLCNGASTGAVNITVNGGVTNYSYLWSNAATTQNISSVAAGTYTVTVTDANNCTAIRSETVTQSAAIAIAETHTDASCFGNATAAIDITVTGGNATYSYLWSNGYNSEDISGVQANTYTVTVTDVNSCTGSRSITVGQPTAFSVTFNYNNVQCNGGADGNIDLTVSGATPGYTYLWNNGATTQDQNNVYAGNYSVTVNDANGCVANANMTITQPNSLVVVTNTHTNVSCFGGSNGAIDITIQGGTFPFVYIWSDGGNTQDRTGLSAGTYQLTVNDQNSCAVSQPVVITQPTALSVTLSATDVLCNGNNNGSITSVITGGTANYTSLWSNGAATQNLNAVVAGTYTVTVTDANSCSLAQTATINQPATLTATAVKADVKCFGGNDGSIDVTVTGGIPAYNYVWNNAATTQDLTSVAAGTFTVNVSDANNCSASVSMVVAQPAALQIALVKTDPTCNGVNNGSIDVTVTGGTAAYTYSWSTGATTEDLSSLGAGSFTVNITDANGCVVTGSEQLVMPASMTVTSSHTNLSCFGSANGTISISVSGGNTPYTYTWSNGSSSQNISGLNAGLYNATVIDSKGCVASVNGVIVNEPSILNVGAVATDVACLGAQNGAVDATVTGGTPPYTYAWSNHTFAEDLINVAANTYKVTVLDANNCMQTAVATVNTLPQLNATAIADTLACVTATGGIDLTVNSGSAPYTYHWSNGATTEDLTDIHPGTYSVTVQDANGCPLDTTFVVTNANSFAVNATGGGTITLGQTIELHATSTGSAQTVFNWTPTYNLDCPTCTDVTVQPGQSTTYTVVGTDVNGCVAQDTVSVNVIADHTIFTPNAFTPNGDGNNDFFQMFGNLAGIRKFSILVFDRWGEKVYDSDLVDFKWDGTYKGELLPPSVCVYVMKAVFLDGFNEKVYKGSITILR